VWRAHAESLSLLDDVGGPYDHAAVRAAFVRAFPGWVDASYAARLADGTAAAVALLSDGRRSVSVLHAYGGVVATRHLNHGEVRALLAGARHAAGTHEIVVRTVSAGVGVDATTQHVGGRVAGWTSVVHLDKGRDLEARYAQKTRKSIRFAIANECSSSADTDPDPFIALYEHSSERHWLRFPDEVLRELAGAGRLLFSNVSLRGRVVSSVAMLRAASHWSFWLAAQNDDGRAVHGNYLATATGLAHAQDQHVRAVDLGSSADMPNVAHFKRRFGAVEVPVVEHRDEDRLGRARRSLRRIRGSLRARAT
jgi:hypothetical protein